MTDLYEVLGIDKTATREEIKRAYQKLAKKNHPDSPDRNEDRWNEVSRAHEVLIDPGKRKVYDDTGIHNDDHDKLVADATASMFIRFFDHTRDTNPAIAAIRCIELENASNLEKIDRAKKEISGINSMLKRLSRSDNSDRDPVREALVKKKSSIEDVIKSATYVMALMKEVSKELRVYRVSPIERERESDTALLSQGRAKFQNVSCSQCGRSFGPGNHGYSHCSDHG
jgi:DnaJ-class molecular chaperone